MNIVMTGASGFLGKELLAHLQASGHQLRALGRNRPGSLPGAVAFSEWSADVAPAPEIFAGADAVIHLAGEPIAQRWTAQAKTRIRDSRVQGTTLLAKTLLTLQKRPQVFICASGIAIYGSRGDEVLTETSSSGSGFLSEVVRDWEAAARTAERAGIRVVCLRFSAVLGNGGALAKMLPPF